MSRPMQPHENPRPTTGRPIVRTLRNSVQIVRTRDLLHHSFGGQFARQETAAAGAEYPQVPAVRKDRKVPAIWRAALHGFGAWRGTGITKIGRRSSRLHDD